MYSGILYGEAFRGILAALCAATVSVNADEWESIFDGKTLENWDGDPDVWSVKDGAITGATSDDEAKKLKRNTFIIWRGGEVSGQVGVRLGDYRPRRQHRRFRRRHRLGHDGLVGIQP